MKLLGYALVASLLAATAAPALAGGGMKHSRAAEWFKSMDTDGDGQISQAEFDAGKPDRFSKFDLDADGKVTLEEMKQAREQLREQRMKRHFEALDADGDGAVSEDEMRARHNERFARLDADKDGFVSADELKQARHHRRDGATGDAPPME